MWGIGLPELLVFGIVAILLFGKRLPEVARSLGQSYQEFRKGLQELKSEVDEVVYATQAEVRTARAGYLALEQDSTRGLKLDPPLSEVTPEPPADRASES